MRKTIAWSLVALSAIVPLRGADWPTHSGDNQRTAWQQDESALTRENVKGLQLLWKLKLDNQSRSVYSLTAPLVVQRLITDRGFKELVYLAGSSDNLFAVDADLGRLFWSRHFKYDADVPQQPTSSFLCPGGLNATPAIQPGQNGDFAFVVKADQTVEMRRVTVGPARDGETVVQKGVKPGETVVIDGQLRLVPGARVDVKPVNALKPEALAREEDP